MSTETTSKTTHITPLERIATQATVSVAQNKQKQNDNKISHNKKTGIKMNKKQQAKSKKSHGKQITKIQLNEIEQTSPINLKYDVDKELERQNAKPISKPIREQRVIPENLDQLKDKAKKKSYKSNPKPTTAKRAPIMDTQLFTPLELTQVHDVARNINELQEGPIVARTGWSITPDGWISLKSVKEPVQSEHAHILVKDGAIPIPNLFINHPVGYYDYREYNDDELRRLTQVMFTKDQSALFYAIRNYANIEPTRFALMVMLLPWIAIPTRDEIISALQSWPLNRQATMDLYNFASMILSKFQRSKPISYSTNITEHNLRNGFILGSQPYHRYTASKSRDPMDSQTFTYNTITNHPVVARYVDKLVDREYEAYKPIYVHFVNGKPDAESASLLDWYGLPYEGLNEEQIVKIVREYNKAMSEMDASTMLSTVGYNLIDRICDFLPASLRPERQDYEVVGECSTYSSETFITPNFTGLCQVSSTDSEDVENDEEREIVLKPTNLGAARSKGVQTGLFYQNQAKSASKHYNTILSSFADYPSFIHGYYRTRNPKFQEVFLVPPPNEEVKEFYQAAKGAFKINTVDMPTKMISFKITLKGVDPNQLQETLSLGHGQFVQFHSLQTRTDGSCVITIAGPDVRSTQRTPIVYTPSYYPPPYVVDNIMFRGLYAMKEPGLEAISKLQHYRRTAGCPMGQIIRYGKEITVNRKVTPAGDISIRRSFRPPQFNLAHYSIPFLKDVWVSGACVINDKSSSGLLYRDQKKSLLTTLFDITVIHRLTKGNGMKIQYEPWMGAHEFKPKYEVTDMDKFTTKTRSIFVGNSFIQTMMTPLFQGVYDMVYDYDQPLSVITDVLFRKHCLGITQQKFLLILHNLSTKQKNKIIDAFKGQKEFLFAYSDNVYYLNVETGTFLSLDGVAMESQVRTTHIDKAFSILYEYDDLCKYGVVVDQDIQPGVYENPNYNPETLSHTQPLDATDATLETIFGMFPDYEEIDIVQKKGKIVWNCGAAINRQDMEDIKAFFKEVFNGTVHAGTMSAPLGFLPSGWYITSLLNTIVSLEFIDQVYKYATEHDCTLFDVCRDPSVIKTHNFTLENDLETNVYGSGFQNTDFLGFNINEHGAMLRWSGLYPSVFFYSSFNTKRSSTEKLAQKMSTWISALFNGGVGDKMFMKLFEDELDISYADDGVVTVLGQHLDEGVLNAVSWETISDMQDIVNRAAEFCGYEPPILKYNNDVRFRHTPGEEITVFDAYKKMAFAMSVASYLDGFYPFSPTTPYTDGKSEQIALEQLRSIKASPDCVVYPQHVNDLKTNPRLVTVSQEDNPYLKQRAKKVLEIIKKVRTPEYPEFTSALTPSNAVRN